MARILSVECTTLRCAVDVIAEAGQDLLVLGGVVVGVAGEEATQVVPRPAAAVAVRSAKSRFLELSRHGQMGEVRRVIGKHELTSREIGDRLGIESGRRNRLATIIQDMRKDGSLVAVNPEARYPRYRVRPIEQLPLAPTKE